MYAYLHTFKETKLWGEDYVSANICVTGSLFHSSLSAGLSNKLYIRINVHVMKWGMEWSIKEDLNLLKKGLKTDPGSIVPLWPMSISHTNGVTKSSNQESSHWEVCTYLNDPFIPVPSYHTGPDFTTDGGFPFPLSPTKNIRYDCELR